MDTADIVDTYSLGSMHSRMEVRTEVCKTQRLRPVEAYLASKFKL